MRLGTAQWKFFPIDSGTGEMPRSKNVDSWIYEQDPSIRQIAQALRGLILKVAPDLKESVKWSNPSYERHGNVAYISATDNDVTVGFFNRVIVDLGKSEKLLRLHFKSLQDVNVPQITTALQEALRLDVMDPR